MKNVRIIVADSQKVVAQGLKMILSKSNNLKVIDYAKGGKELLKLLKEKTTDLIIMDVTMPEMDGIDTMRELKKTYPDLKVLAYSALNEIEYINSMRIEGAKGYVLKGGDDNELLEAIQSIMAGHVFLSPAAQKTVDKGYDHTVKDPKGKYVGLTVREREIIKLVALEKTSVEISEALFLSIDTIKTHRKNLMNKLNVRGAAGLVKYAIDRGWIN